MFSLRRRNMSTIEWKTPKDLFYAFYAWGCTSICTLLRNVNLKVTYNKSAKSLKLHKTTVHIFLY